MRDAYRSSRPRYAPASPIFPPVRRGRSRPRRLRAGPTGPLRDDRPAVKGRSSTPAPWDIPRRVEGRACTSGSGNSSLRTHPALPSQAAQTKTSSRTIWGTPSRGGLTISRSRPNRPPAAQGPKCWVPSVGSRRPHGVSWRDDAHETVRPLAPPSPRGQMGGHPSAEKHQTRAALPTVQAPRRRVTPTRLAITTSPA